MKGNRVRNWSDYNKALVKRGEITLWLSEDCLKQASPATKEARRGRPYFYSDALIEAALVLKNVYHLSFRSLEGFLRSIFHLSNLSLKVPHYSTLQRRQRTVRKHFRFPCPKQAVHLVVDSTGLKIYGEGEWCVKKHGANYQRTWRKVHLAINARSLEILSCQLTTSRTQDFDVLSPLLAMVKGPINSVSGDGAYDQFKCYETLYQRKAKAIFPPRRDAKLSTETPYHKKVACSKAIKSRDQAILSIRSTSRSHWKQVSGYHQRSLAETTMFRLKCILGERLKAKSFDNQALEMKIRCVILNRMSALGLLTS